MSTLKVINLQHPSYANNNVVLDANGNVTVAGTVAGGTSAMFRNRIINGDMRIDQRNSGVSVTPASGNSTFMTDRFSVLGTQASKFTAQQNAGSVTPPVGFSHYLGITSSSSYTSLSTDLFRIFHSLEGYTIVDFAWGTASAKPITISFWVRSSLTGTFGGCLQNQTNNRAYAFTYTISASSTWEYKTITIAGETSGSWATNNGVGLAINFDLGSGSTKQISPGSWQTVDANAATGCTSIIGTSGATFYITGIQVEVGSVATPFERRPYGMELDLCYRYCQAVKQGIGCWVNATTCQINVPYIKPMRAAPSVIQTNTITVTDYIASDLTQSSNSISILNGNDLYGSTVSLGNFSGATSGRVAGIRNYTGTGVIIFSAEM